jgi:bla regulator protein BlaR1
MSAIGDHLWQSTLFALAAGLLTLVLRRNRASDRYLVWLAASIKFLVPFSLLVDIGGHLAWSQPVTQGWLYFAVNEIGQPFAQPIVPGSSGVPAVIASRLSPLLPAMLAAVWFCGFGMVLTHWYLRWRNISVALRSAVPLRAGCEVEALRRMERIAEIRRPIAVFSSPVVPEPGVFACRGRRRPRSVARPPLGQSRGCNAHVGASHILVPSARMVARRAADG